MARILRFGVSPRGDISSYDYAIGIARALRDDFGESASTLKEICEGCGAAPGTVKKWLASENGPDGRMLMRLMVISPAVRRFVDDTTGRVDIVSEHEQRLRVALAVMAGDPVVALAPKLEADLAEAERRPAAPSMAKREPASDSLIARAAR